MQASTVTEVTVNFTDVFAKLTFPWSAKAGKVPDKSPVELYDLKSDVSEQNDRSEDSPDHVERLYRAYVEYRSSRTK